MKWLTMWIILCGVAVAGEAAKPPSKEAEAASQRFLPIQAFGDKDTPWHGFLALDTKTGSLCRTLDVHFPGMTVDQAPLCRDLYLRKFEAGSVTNSKADPLGIR